MKLVRAISEQALSKVAEIVVAANPNRESSSFRFNARYYMLVENHIIKAVVGLRKLSWYLTEIKHLAVPQRFRGHGYGKKAVVEVLKKVKTPTVCATVRVDNNVSLNLFLRCGFRPVMEFDGESGKVLLMVNKVHEEADDEKN